MQTARQGNPFIFSMDLACVPHYIDPERYKLALLLLTVGNYCLINQAMGVWLTDFSNTATFTL